MRKFDLSLRSSRSSYFATFRHQLTILSKTDALDEEKWLNMLGRRRLRSFAASWLLNALLRIFAMSIITPKRKVLRMSVQDCWRPPLWNRVEALLFSV